MAQCIKCGREIPEGEIFCPECSLNPGAPGAQPRPAPVQIGRMQAPVKQAPPPRSEQRSPQPARPRADAPLPPSRQRTGRGLTILACILAVIGLGLAAWQFSGTARQQRTLRIREEALTEREKQLTSLETQIDTLSAELAAAQETSSAQAREIKALQESVSSAESSANQSQYDLTEQQKELEKTSDENEALAAQIEALEKENARLSEDYDVLYAQLDAQSAQLKFMDSYVVFVEDDGTGCYHRYGCSRFLKKNFWAYSRKLAERQGYTPCAVCFD